MAQRSLLALAWPAMATLVAALLLTAAPAESKSEEWNDLQKAFQDTWVVSRVDSVQDLDDFLTARLKRPPAKPKKPLALDKLEKLRGQKRSAAKGLRASEDARAVLVLMGAHGKQLKLIQKLKKLHGKFLQPWKRAQPKMEASIRIKQEAALRSALQRDPNVDPKEVTYGVTAQEARWQKHGGLLRRIWTEVLAEEEIAEYTRKAMGTVTSSVEGDEHTRALGALLKAAGNGDDPDQLEFIRVLGYVAGDPVTDALEKFASSMQPFAVQAALEALGRQNAERSIDTLLGRLDDPRWQVRASALRGLSFYQDARVVEALLERVAQEDGVMQRHYFVALNTMVGTEVTATHGAWAKWWSENKAKALEAWKTGGRVGPVEHDPEAVMARSQGGGRTSFYGVQTDSKHIIFVLDISGSMGEFSGKDANGKYRIDVAKRELKKAIRSLSSDAKSAGGQASFNVVVYAEGVEVYKEGKMIPATKKNKEKVLEWIDELEAIGPTNIFDALEQAFLIIGTRKAKKQLEKGADTIFLMTDGEPNRGRIVAPPLIRQEIAKMNRDRRITINTIGVGEGHDAKFLEKLATENHGEYLAFGTK